MEQKIHKKDPKVRKVDPEGSKAAPRVPKGTPKVYFMSPPRCEDAPEACHGTTNRCCRPPKAWAAAPKIPPASSGPRRASSQASKVLSADARPNELTVQPLVAQTSLMMQSRISRNCNNRSWFEGSGAVVVLEVLNLRIWGYAVRPAVKCNIDGEDAQPDTT